MTKTKVPQPSFSHRNSVPSYMPANSRQNCEHRSCSLMWRQPCTTWSWAVLSAQTSKCHTIWHPWQQDCQLWTWVWVQILMHPATYALPHFTTQGRQSCPLQHPEEATPIHAPANRATDQRHNSSPNSSHVTWLQLWWPQDQGQSYWFKDKAVDLYLLKSFC